MPYFKDNSDLFQLEPSGKEGLRSCQLGAIWSLKSYKTTGTKDIAALISMPTGSGKTALMMAACFELKFEKILIVVPSKILRRQISQQFRELKILKDKGCLKEKAEKVSVFEVTSRKNSREEWENILENHDVIVAHPNSISPYYEKLAPIPSELIDAVIVDEAHHEPAPTWQSLNSFYKNQFKIFLTATPFRRDRKRMRAKLVYHYSLEQALNENILRPIEFRGESRGLHDANSNEALIGTAVEVYGEEKAINQNASILIRTDTIDDAKNLKNLYNEAGFSVDVIHSKRSPKVNEELVDKVKNNELDGLVCIGIASEGLDIPNLKVAVLHSTPRSIPYTIQFLGRISRAPIDQEGPAKLIANTDQVKGEVRRLYKSDASWSKIIPEIIDEQMEKARHYRSSKALEEDFQMPELNVYFSALIYQTPPDFDFKQEFSTKDNSEFEIIHYEQANDDSPLIIITSHNKPIDWANREIYTEDLLDIHILYHVADYNLLFELTTSEMALDSFKEELIPIELKSISTGRLFKTLSKFSSSDYIMVGLRNSALTGASNPAYKTVVGSSVQSAIRTSEGRIFAPGHALLRLDEENSWGIATRKGRVWAMRRGTAEEFKEWCDQLCNLIQDGPILTNLPGLTFLAKTEPNESILELPVAIIPDDLFFKSYSITYSVKDQDPFRNDIPRLIPEKIGDNNDCLEGHIAIKNYRFKFKMDFKADELWNVENSDNLLIHAERRDATIIDKDIKKVLNEFPPSLIMPDGSVLFARNKIIPNRSIESLPSEIWVKQQWNGCDITSEAYVPNPQGNIPVINFTVDLMKASMEFNDETDLIILDDGAHEIADLIYFENKNSTIYFIHCKYSSSVNSGCRKKDSDELFAQAMRSIHWISNSVLMDRINYRIENTHNSQVVSGRNETLEILTENFRINEWKFKILLVQPGFNIDQVSDKGRNNNNVYESVIPMYERILGSNGLMEIWGQ
ncbi:DEAD/DEAH box helicase [Zunongwangia atlantica]|uniref:Type III restriction protein res subunit n=1 Tax=Zunongwangia atlantica 22II14-10F7 TaxID=1185767 RepID=A0A1Y1SXW4_9FLAO|nr:DEAD/DEAH box helicase family protein [Zunongwangia atlantica]ORL43616.1 type III restriction protein res subunit [Zunongwangia atlantica 22II14-10F7]